MTTTDFDTVIERRHTASAKWSPAQGVTEGVLPLYVADMDFRSPQPVIDALHERVEHGLFGYTVDPPSLSEAVCERMKRLYAWDVAPEHLIFVPGLVFGSGIVCRAVGKNGDGVVIQSPVYGPFYEATKANGRFAHEADLEYVLDDASAFHYEIDFDRFETAIAHPQVSMFMLCNPHNPGGRVFRRDELERMAEICLKHDVVICSDEIHGELLLSDSPHIPIASLSPEISARTITMIAPSKTFNLAGLAASVLIVQDEALREQVKAVYKATSAHVNLFGYAAMEAAYRYGDEWLEQLLVYLKGNRDYVVDYVREHLPAIKTTVPEGTYLAWLDCRELPVENPQQFFMDDAKVKLNEGTFFGTRFGGFVRLNFGCPRSILAQALDRIHDAVDRLNVSQAAR